MSYCWLDGTTNMHSQSDSQLLITQLHVQATSHPFNQNNFAQPAQLLALLGAAQSLLSAFEQRQVSVLWFLTKTEDRCVVQSEGSAVCDLKCSRLSTDSCVSAVDGGTQQTCGELSRGRLSKLQTRRQRPSVAVDHSCLRR